MPFRMSASSSAQSITRFKVAAIQVEKVWRTWQCPNAFPPGPGDSPEPHELETDIPNENGYLPVSVTEIDKFSPNTAAILGIRNRRDLRYPGEALRTGTLLGDKSTRVWVFTTPANSTCSGRLGSLFPPQQSGKIRVTAQMSTAIG